MPGSGDGDAFEDAVDDPVAGQLLRLCLVGDDDAVPQHVAGDRLDVVRRYVVAAFDVGVRFRRLRQVDRRAGRRAELNELP